MNGDRVTFVRVPEGHKMWTPGDGMLLPGTYEVRSRVELGPRGRPITRTTYHSVGSVKCLPGGGAMQHETSEVVRMSEPTDEERVHALTRALRTLVNMPSSNFAISNAQLIMESHGRLESEDETQWRFNRKTKRVVGITPAWLGVTITDAVTINGKHILCKYKVVDLAPNRPVNKVVLETSRGRRRYASVQWCRDRLAAHDLPNDLPAGLVPEISKGRAIRV